MGQYFKAVNIDKQEYVCPWCIGGVAKLIEWAANPQGAIFTLLLRKSDHGGGGDYFGYKTQNLVIDTENPQTLVDALRAGVAMEGRPIEATEDSIVGRWAGDRVMLVGDYDSSKLWDRLPAFRNISKEVVEAWNTFMDLSEMKLKYTRCSTCSEQQQN